MFRLKAFIVEDSAVIRENLIAALEELAPVDVVGSADDELGATAWLVARAGSIHLLVVDLFLKSGSGLGVLQEAVARTPGLRVVVLSNFATPEMRVRCLAMGASRVFDKSNEIDALIVYCEELAGGLT
ncbi:MAG TPA: response regulator [Burkholderiaceae bacterium]|jgi:DNA-binding NarL/FixJ family response regulator